MALADGDRAVDHCVEAICANSLTPLGCAVAARIETSDQWSAAREGGANDLDARLDCQMGTWLSMGALATGTLMGASHGIGYVLAPPLTSPTAIPPASCCPRSCSGTNRPLPIGRRWSPKMGSADEDAGGLLDRFIGGLGMPRSLSAVEIGPENFEMISEQAMGTPWVPLNPRPIDGPRR